MYKEQKMIPGEALIYERDDRGTIYARYRDPPHNTKPRWVIGGPSDSYSRLGFGDWQEIKRLAETHHTLAKQLDKLLNLYYLIKDQEKQ